MKAKTLSTVMKDLYGVNEYPKYIQEGDEFRTDAALVQEITHKKWNKIHVTYVRSKVMFFTIIGVNVQEQYFPTHSYAAATMIKAKIDPYVDFHWHKNLDNYRFDDTFTEVVNFDNRKDKEIDDNLKVFY